MEINAGDINLVFTDVNDEEVAGLISDVEDLFNMSETRLYPPHVPKEMIFRIEKNNTLLGEIRLKNIRYYNRKAELGIILKKEYHGVGYGKKAVEALMSYAFNKMNLYRLEAEVIEYNKSSIKLVESLGFVREGVLRKGKYNEGSYWDIYRYGILSEEYKEFFKNP